MFFMPFADNQRNLILFLISTGAVLLSMSFYRSPAVALMPDITPRELRSKGNAVIMLMGTAGVIYSMIMIKVLVKTPEGAETPDYMPLFLSMMAFMFIGTLILVLTVPENKWSKEVKDNETPEEKAENQNAGKKISKEKLKSLIFILLSVFLWYMSYNAISISSLSFPSNLSLTHPPATRHIVEVKLFF